MGLIIFSDERDDGYNRLITQRNRYQNACTQINVQLQRRYDPIPNLGETTKGYLSHERETGKNWGLE
jgi:LemA protein